MINPEQGSRSPYRQFSEGDNLWFTLNRLCPDGSLATQECDARIEAIKGGGFFGQVLLLRDHPFILKTGIPGDPWHDLWRRVNWGARDFPYQVNELDAQLGQVTTDIIHETVAPITQGRFYAPRSFGYTRLPGTFAQGVERLYGRPPRYDNHQGEFRLFRQAQVEITEVAYKLGLEHVGQVHTDNPFAMANLWWNESFNRWEWFDTLPAIQHTGWVWPLFYFRFHHQIRQRLNPDTRGVTFDRIHTDMYLETVRKNEGLFNGEVLERIQDKVALYESLMRKRENEEESPRNFKGLADAAKKSASGFGEAIVGSAKGAIVTPVRILTDSTYIDKLVLGGARKALDTGILPEAEFQEAVALVQSLSQQERGRNRFLKILKGLSGWGGLYAYYHVSGTLLKVPELTAYASLGLTGLVAQDDWLSKSAIFLGIFSGFRVLGGLNSFLATKLVGLMTGRNLDTAAAISAIPVVGLHLAIPAQLCVDVGSKSKTIWHYAVRDVIAKISKIHPAGGWGTELEGKLWGLLGLGERLEGLAKARITHTPK